MDFSNVKKVFLPSRLPIGYQEVEYIQGETTTQYIDTGVSLRDYDQNLDITIDFQETFIGNIAVGLVSSGAYSGLYWFTFPEVASKVFYIQMAAGTWATISPKPSGRCLIKSNSKTGVVSVDDFSCTTTTQSFIDYANEHNITNNGNLYLFGANNLVNDSVSIGASRVYYALFKNATTGEKIKEFIPCYRTSDNKIGMFDLVTKSFYPSNGSSDFTIKGNDVDTGAEVIKISMPSGEVTHNLPTEYQEVDYIESTGTQYINTGVSTSGNKGKEFIQELEICLTGTSSSDYQVFSGNDCCESFSINKNSTKNYDIEFLNQWHKVKSQRVIAVNRSAWVDDVLVSTGTTTYMYSAPICVFCSNFGSPFRFSKAKMKYYKLYFEGTLVRNMIPCYRKSDGVIGMYDTVGSTFYTNAGNGNFAKGSDITGEIVLWETWLPSQYQEVEYIRGVSSEGPYIDTDFTTSLTMKMEADAKCNGLGDCVLATMPISASTNSNFSLGRYNGTTAYMCWNGREIGGGDWSTRKTMIAYQDDGTIYRQLGEDVSSISVSLQTLSTPSKLWLFRRNDGGTPSTSSGDVTLYGCKLYDNNILQRHFIPCYRKSDNEIGLYDRVTKTFFTNQGTGAFTKGPDVT